MGRVCRSGFIVFVIALTVIWAPVRAQDAQVTTLRGQVLNSVTKEPVPHALVTLMGEQFAKFTDDEGRYEFQIQSEGNARGGSVGTIFINRVVNARKPGFLDSVRTASSVTHRGSPQETQSDVTVYLVPEALIVGHVDVPGTEGEVRITCELYRKEMRAGRETWTSSASRTSWASGEFRFSSLQAGTYKLITHEEMDRDSLAQVPGAPLFGYPPVYYPNTTDFSAAGEIAVKAGQTAQVNLTVARHEYYPVRIGIRNGPAGQPINVAVWPMGHWGPGWSLGYNPAEPAIEGMLPNGNYTVEAHGLSEQTSTGIANFSVKGRPAEGPAIIFVPDAAISVSVRQEFHADQAAGDNSAAPSAQARVRRTPIPHITLFSLDDSNMPMNVVHAHQVEGSQGREYTIPSVRPGRYQVEMSITSAYVSAMESGGKDLLHEPLVVPLGGSVPPIEITLRDDGAEVDGTINDPSDSGGNSQSNQAMETPPHIVYLVPVAGGSPTVAASQANGSFSFPQVAPGDYVLLAFTDQQQAVESGSQPLAQELQSKGQTVHLEVGQKVNVKLDLLGGSVE